MRKSSPCEAWGGGPCEAWWRGLAESENPLHRASRGPPPEKFGEELISRSRQPAPAGPRRNHPEPPIIASGPSDFQRSAEAPPQPARCRARRDSRAESAAGNSAGDRRARDFLSRAMANSPASDAMTAAWSPPVDAYAVSLARSRRERQATRSTSQAALPSATRSGKLAASAPPRLDPAASSAGRERRTGRDAGRPL